jgi:ParB family transcriptional regulator, chromosome partitioning protein
MEELSTQGPVFLIEVEKIVPNPQQPRREFKEEALRELAGSIREVGLLQPIVVSKIEKEIETGTSVEYQLIAGERRLMASKLLGLERIPAIIKQVNLERERLELALVENIQRENLNPIEEARAYARFQDEFGMTQRELATRIGKSREVVANTLRLLNLPTEVQTAIAKGQMSESQARLLLGVSDPAKQKILFNEAIQRSFSVRQLRDRIRDARDSGPEGGEGNPINPTFIQIQKDLETVLGTKVKLDESGGSGKITISFFSPEELRGIIQKLTNKTSEFEPAPEFSLDTKHEDNISEVPLENQKTESDYELSDSEEESSGSVDFSSLA